jgi:hypothetical protein
MIAKDPATVKDPAPPRTLFLRDHGTAAVRPHSGRTLAALWPSGALRLPSGARWPPPGRRPGPPPGYTPRPRPMISFMISVVPPKIVCTRPSANARATGYSNM